MCFSNNDSSNHVTTTNNKVIPVTIVSWSCNDRMVATAYENGLIKVWEPNHGTLLNELKVNFKILFGRKISFGSFFSET
jgi:WD40 repeat protein